MAAPVAQPPPQRGSRPFVLAVLAYGHAAQVDGYALMAQTIEALAKRARPDAEFQCLVFAVGADRKIAAKIWPPRQDGMAWPSADEILANVTGMMRLIVVPRNPGAAPLERAKIAEVCTDIQFNTPIPGDRDMSTIASVMMSPNADGWLPRVDRFWYELFSVDLDFSKTRDYRGDLDSLQEMPVVQLDVTYSNGKWRMFDVATLAAYEKGQPTPNVGAIAAIGRMFYARPLVTNAKALANINTERFT